MGTEVKKKTTKVDAYITYRSLYYSGKVKPSLNKILVELENDPENFDLTLLACECLLRTKNYPDLATYADRALKIDSENAQGYFYKGVAIQHCKGKEQEALKNFNEGLALDPTNTMCLKHKALTHLMLYKDYHLPIKFAEKHRVKAEEGFKTIIMLIEAKESPTYKEYLTIGDVCTLMTQSHDAKRYYIKAVNTFEAAEEADQDKNVYKEIIKAQKACTKLIEKYTE